MTKITSSFRDEKNKNINKKQKNLLGKIFQGRNLWSLANKAVLVIIFVLGITYMVSINDLSIKGFVLHELKTEASGLNESNRDINLMITKLESYEHIAKRALEMDMVEVDKVDYITIGIDGVARR